MSDVVHAANSGRREFRYLESGEGPAVVLWHGFPDLPQSWDSIRAALAANGYRAIAPYLRGYHPDTIVPGLGYGADELAADGLALLDALGLDKAVVMGHDWGASIAYGLAELAPERVRAISIVDIPHPATVKPNPKLLWGVRHFLGLKMPWASRTMRRNDFAHVDRLYRRWSPDWHGPERQRSVAAAKIAFEDPRVLEAALDYYRALRPGSGEYPKLPMSALLFVGGGTPEVVEAFANSADAFAADVDVLVDIVPGAGHWAHRENETHVLDALLPWLARVHARVTPDEFGRSLARRHRHVDAAGLPEMRLHAYAENLRHGDWSLRSALVRFAQPQPALAAAVLHLVRRLDAALRPYTRALDGETVATGTDDGLVGDARVRDLARAARTDPEHFEQILAAYRAETDLDDDDLAPLELLTIAVLFDELADDVTRWAHTMDVPAPADAVDAACRVIHREMERLDVPEEEIPEQFRRRRG